MKSCCVFIVWISASVRLALRSRSWFLFQGNATVIPHREEDAYFHQVLKAMDILRISVSYPTSWVFYKLCAPDVFFLWDGNIILLSCLDSLCCMGHMVHWTGLACRFCSDCKLALSSSPLLFLSKWAVFLFLHLMETSHAVPV